MIKINVNENRDEIIMFQGLQNMDGEYTFYYDETNNGRKFHLEKGYFNISVDQNFILGGLVYDGRGSVIDTTDLFQSLKLQKTTTEIKFKHIASGELIDVLKSKKMNQILKWIYSHNLYLHYTNLNPLYFGIVDIIDSAIVSSATTTAFDISFANHVKNEFYLALNENIEKTVEIFFEYGYPSIDKDRIGNFIDDIIELVTPYRDVHKSHLGIETAIQILKASKKKKKLPFIEDGTKYTLMHDYSIFYMQPLCMFKNSMHYFDREDLIKTILEQYEFLDGNRKLDHYEFVDSKENGLIQLSDIMMGFLGKLYAFVRQKSVNDIKNIRGNLGEIERGNLDLINKLTWRSQIKCKGFLFKSISDDEKIKERILLP